MAGLGCVEVSAGAAIPRLNERTPPLSTLLHLSSRRRRDLATRGVTFTPLMPLPLTTLSFLLSPICDFFNAYLIFVISLILSHLQILLRPLFNILILSSL